MKFILRWVAKRYHIFETLFYNFDHSDSLNSAILYCNQFLLFQLLLVDWCEHSFIAVKTIHSRKILRQQIWLLGLRQRYTYWVLQTIQMKPMLLCVWAEPDVWGSTKTALNLKYEILIGQHTYNSMYGAEYKLEKLNENHGLNHELFL